MMRQILRIRDDVREMLQTRHGETTNRNTLNSFPFMETGLFIAVGLFVLLAMKMMVHFHPLGEYNTRIPEGADLIKNIRILDRT